MKKSAELSAARTDRRRIRETRGDRVTNPSDGGNTRANKFPGLARGEGVGAILAQNPIRATARGGSAAFFWKIAGDPGIFVRLYRCIRSSAHSSLRVTARDRKVIFARARLTRGSKLFSLEGETGRKAEREREREREREKEGRSFSTGLFPLSRSLRSLHCLDVWTNRATSPPSRREREREREREKYRVTFLEFHSCQSFKYKHDARIHRGRLFFWRRETRPYLSAFNPFAGNLVIELLSDHYRSLSGAV